MPGGLSPVGAPAHVFGDLTQRLSKRTRRALLTRHAAAQREVKARAENGEDFKKLTKDIGDEMMEDFVRIMEMEKFSAHATAWCLKCKKNCRVHGPEQAPTACSRVVLCL